MQGSLALLPGTAVAVPPNMRRDMRKSWRWFFIGRLAVILAFTPEVRAAATTVPYPNPEAVAAHPHQAPPVPQLSVQDPAKAAERFAILPVRVGAGYP